MVIAVVQGGYDFSGVQKGDGLRIGAQMFRVERWRAGLVYNTADQTYQECHKFDLVACCAECGREFRQPMTDRAVRRGVKRRCEACRAKGPMKRDVVEERKPKKRGEIAEPVNLEAQTEGNFVRYRGRDYQVLRVVGYLRTNGVPHDRLDLVGTCAVCGKTFPHRAEDDDTRLPLRCRPCRQATGRAWRYGG